MSPQDLTVYYEVEGSASNGEDYSSLPGSVLIPAGESSAQIQVAPIDDSSPEGLESVHIFLTSGPGYQVDEPSNDFVFITDGDGAPAGPNLDIIAFRPQTRSFRPTPVPAATEDTVGAGMRVNGDYDNGSKVVRDWDDSIFGIDAEDDLIRIDLDFGAASDGVNYFLKRSNHNVRVWTTANKANLILGDNDEQQLTRAPVRSLWVEWVSPTFTSSSTTLTFEARDAQTNAVVGTADSVRLFNFTSIVIVFGGRTQKPSDPPRVDEGIFVVGKQLYAEDAYDVYMFEHTGVTAAFREVANAVNNRFVTQVAILGYSWGGSATYQLADWLTWAAERQRDIYFAFTIAFTAYIDAVSRKDLIPLTYRPPSSQYHVNYYEDISWVHGAHIQDLRASDREVYVTGEEWGADLRHTTIEDDIAGGGRIVLNAVRNALLAPGLQR